MCSEMKPCIRSRSNDKCQFITDVGIFALAFPFPLLLPFGAIAVSWKWIYIRNIIIMIQLHVAEGSPEGKYKVVRLSGVLWNERHCFVQVTWCRDEDAVGVYNTGGTEWGGLGRKKGYIYWSSGDFLVQLVILLVNEHKTAQPSSCRTTRHLMNDKPRDEI